ncbi:SOS response-associated peptidase [Niallia endozanthoxylica]|uniref:Abasic site processing protein n=1 Tax=Niallia endozanthoxylica TaxID=2036016 RepID=A0A5J5H0C3_9BACI|nr:SOS response-associated peptidase [Niallia endozanthoxylica]KAA9014056.1 SOS response-associated peptidase [Niallia endozanthoxylica]
MCGRFTLSADFSEIIERFAIEAAIEEELYQLSYNIAPSHSVLSVINDGSRNRLGYLKWGLIPNWAKDQKIGFKLINARAETLAEKPSFRDAYMKRRCLVIADSFYEWKRHDQQNKTPMRIKLKTDELFAMAGLWERWKSSEGKTIFSCTVITTTPNEVVKDIHDRMPVILKKEDEQTWLNPSIQDPHKLNSILKPLPEEFIEAYEVSNLVNSPKNNSPQLIEKIC